MAERKVTSVPQIVLLQPEAAIHERAINWLASTGIIVAGSNKWTFIHQTFFDYCFAREFVEQGGDLVEQIVHSDQGIIHSPSFDTSYHVYEGDRSCSVLERSDSLIFHRRHKISP